MADRRRATVSSASYTGFRAVEGFQYPSVWKKAAQSMGAVLLVCGASVVTCSIHRLVEQGFDCSATCSNQTITDVAAIAISCLDVVLHVLLLLGLQNGWPVATIAVVVWNAVKGAIFVYFFVQTTYQLQTEGKASLVFDHYVAQVALVIVQAVVLYTLASAAHEQRSANKMDGDGLP